MEKDTGLLDKLASLSPAKRALLEKKLNAKKGTTAAIREIARRTAEGSLPLSFAQQRLWFLEQLEPGTATYNLANMVRLTGTLRLDVLERTIAEIISRHESLRTTFRKEGDDPVQVIAQGVPFTLAVTDIGTLPEDAREAEIDRLARLEAETPFDLASGPLLRAQVIRVADTDHVLLMTIHHIVSDGWSMGVLVQEMVALYSAFAKGEQSPLPELPIQYPDYSLWQQQYLKGEVLDKQLGYWKEKLAGPVPVLQLPTDRPRPAVQTFNGDQHPLTLEGRLVDALKELSRVSGSSLFITLMAAYQVLLYRYTNQDDLTVGSPIAGRNQSKTEGLIGFFVNTLVFRAQLDQDLTFRDFLAQVRQTAFDAFANQDIPFEKLVGELLTERSLSHSPLFQVMFALQNAPKTTFDLPGVNLQVVDMESKTAKFDLLMSLTEEETGIRGSLEYNTDLFDASTIERMAAHFETLLQNIAANPDQKVSELVLLPAAERNVLLHEWPALTKRDYVIDRTLAQLFEAQVERTPDAVAAVYGTERLTYRELNERANRLAHHLQKLGVTSEVFVGVCMSRTFDIVTSMLAIHKAGGAYVPVDPAYPEDRIAYMLQDSKATVLLTESKLAGELPAHGAHVICVDQVRDALLSESADNPTSPTHVRNLAYVIYTSGSTGKPKGVAIEHFSAATLIEWTKETYSPEELSGMLFSTSICFDLSVYELFGTLSTGGKIIIADNALALPNLPAKDEVTLINTVPSAINELLRMKTIPASVRTVNLAGEPLKGVLVQQLYDIPTIEKVWNLYGPSEDTTYSTGAIMERNSTTVPKIGLPLPNTQVYIVDKNLEPVPIGVVGELVIGGDGLARGYLYREELTAEKFVPNPFEGQPSPRLYKTGDLARFLADGTIDYLGRIDNQVKMRGFRIELGEIENLLSRYQGMRETAVIVREDVPGDKRIVAYLVPSAPESFDVAAARMYLKEHLPEYMIPSAFLLLDALPQTPNGKLDRKALPKPDAVTEDMQKSYIAPRTDSEARIADIWANVLHIDQVGVEHNFFELGGHSLLATQIMSRINSEFGTDLPLRNLFGAPTVAGLAAYIDHAQTSTRQVLPLVARGEEHPPLSFTQERLWFFEQFEPGSALYNIPFSVRLKGRLDRDALQKSFQAIVDRHANLRTTFHLIDGEPVQEIADTLALDIPVIDLSDLTPEARDAETTRLAEEEGRKPFHLSNGPLFRLNLLVLGNEEHVLLLNMHHIISDGWSIGVLVEELSALYAAFVRGEEAPLPALPIQYGDFAAWQREHLQGDVLDEQLAYWKQQLGGKLPTLQLPTDRQRPAMQTYTGALHTFRIRPELLGKLKDLSKQGDATLFMTLLSAFNVFLHRYTGQDDILVGSPIANRTRPELEALIGFFVNVIVLRNNLNGGSVTFRELLDASRHVTLDAYAHQDLPFEKLVEALQPERNLSFSPLFQVMFVLQNAPMRYDLPGLSLDVMDIGNGTSKYDLTLAMFEDEQGLRSSFEYNADLFDASTIERMARNFETLLESIAANPDQTVSELGLLPAAERDLLLTEWTASTHRDYVIDRTLAQLFEAQAARTPDNVAAIWGTKRLTYRELNERANRLAHHLQKLGVTSEVFVGVCMERTFDIVISMLAIHKAGGAYVPLDPAYPNERIAYMLEDSQATVLLTQAKLLPELPQHNATVICVDQAGELLQSEPTDNPASPTHVRHLAYLIYTSGSTGKPKGVAIEHFSAATLIEWAKETYTPHELSGVLFATSICFDLSVYELFVTLSTGGKIIIADNALALPNLPAKDEVTLINTVPSAIAELLRMDGIPSTVCTVNLAGEPLKGVLVQQLYDIPTIEKVWNLYGPSEDTTYSTGALMERGSTEAPKIGVPLPNTQAYIVDKNMVPVPVGVAGELLLGGDGLARGYLNREELTAEKFIANPFAGQPSKRVYKTGDLTRFLADGTIEYLGRIDHQVKIRGFRVELGEIEERLSTHPSVREVVLVVKEIASGDQRLVAYLSFHEGQSVETSDLRAYLKERLPEYMVPSIFMVLDTLPLTPNGKVDRLSLPAPVVAQTESAAYEAPTTATEEMLATIWAEILHLNGISATDNFFELGGHSLLATQISSRVRGAFDVALPLRALFETPTIRELAAFIDAKRLEAGETSLPPILKKAAAAEPTLSFAQERLWFLEQMEPGTATYNMPFAISLRGVLNAVAMENSLKEVVSRHEVLRTNFQFVNGRAELIVNADNAFALTTVDLQGLPADIREARSLELAKQEAARPFDLASDLMMRATLYLIGPEEHILFLNMHHIASDGWSMTVLLQEISALYGAFATGAPSPLPELPIQYADFAAWEKQYLSGGALQGQMSYWKQKLGGELPVLQLPTDRPRQTVQTLRGATESFAIDPQVADSLKRLSQAEGATLFMTMLAAYKTWLSRFSGQDDILVGTPVAHRTREEIEPLIGFFVNTLVMRTDLSGNIAFRDLLARVRKTTLDAYAHQDVPFEKLVGDLLPERSLSHSPLFQAAFTLQNAPVEAVEVTGLTFAPLRLETDTAKFELTLSLTETETGIDCELEYNTDLFDAATIQRMLHHFNVLLASIAAQPDAPLGSLSVLDEADRRQLLVEWNDVRSDYATDLVAHHLVEAQAARIPDALAVVSDTGRLTYGELNANANQLARHLQQAGIGRGHIVGVCMERSPELVTALLAIWKTGAAYLPIDVEYPTDRIRYMLEDAKASLLLTKQHLLVHIGATTAAAMCLDADWEKAALHEPHNLGVQADADQLAYVIYTSGSTGKPKGVAIAHRSLLNLVFWHQRAYGVTEADRATLTAGPAFDASVWELWPHLTAGAALFIPNEETRLVPALLRDWLLKNEITISFQPTPIAENLLFESWPCEAKLRFVLTGGDRLRYYPSEGLPFRLVNHYGPTESTVVTTCATVPSAEKADSAPSIGRPIANTYVLLLDEHLQPVPVGVPGELYIGGLSLALGYLHREDLTRERFLPNPFAEIPGDRLYRTGDLVRYLADGSIEYLERADNQVKIRGFRIEIGEIESQLGKHPAVRETAVLAREDVPGDKRLVGYAVVDQTQVPNASVLRDHLKAALPDYMIPSAFVFLDAMPLTANGKIDRKALPAPQAGADAEAAERILPRNVLEWQLAKIWEDVLGIRGIGVTDNFFTLGGHSLLAVKLTAQVRAELGHDLPLTAFFQEGTIEGIARFLSASDSRAKQSVLIPLQPNGTRVPFFCVHPVGGSVLPYAELAQALGSDQPFYGLQALGFEAGETPHNDLEKMAALYVEEITRVQAHGPYALGGWSVGGAIAYEMARQLRKRGEEVSLLALFDTYVPDAQELDLADETAWLKQFAADLAGTLSLSDQAGLWDELSGLGADEALHRLFLALQDAERLPAGLAEDQWTRLYRVFRANLEAYLAYAPQPSNERLLLFKAAESAAQTRLSLNEEATNGWGALVPGIDVHVLSGTHFTLLKAPQVADVAERLQQALESELSAK